MHRDDEGNIILTVLIILVASSLIVTITLSVMSGLRTSRRSGDSANALQLADAGVNDAIKRITNDTTTANGGSLPTITASLGTAGSYSVVAVKENAAVWHVTSVGTDPTGVKRKIKADAVSEPLFSNAVFAQGNMVFHAGSAVDSYLNGLNQANTCTLKGFVGSNDPSHTNLTVSGGGNGNRNCTQGLSGAPPSGNAAYPYVYDGCVAYDSNNPPTATWQATGDSCGQVVKHYPPFHVFDPPKGDPAVGPLDCAAPTYLDPGIHHYTSVTLRDGCVLVDPGNTAITQDKPVVLISDGNITLGDKSNNTINRYPGTCPGTASSGNDYYSSDSAPLSYYCPNWAGKLQIYGVGSAGTVSFANHVDFWGLVYATSYQITGSGGSPHARIWGAIYGSSLSSSAQFTVHYDEALALITTGRYGIENWREEPLP